MKRKMEDLTYEEIKAMSPEDFNKLCAEYQIRENKKVSYENYTEKEIADHKALSTKSIKNGWTNLTEAEKNRLHNMTQGYNEHYHKKQKKKLDLIREKNKRNLKAREKRKEKNRYITGLTNAQLDVIFQMIQQEYHFENSRTRINLLERIQDKITNTLNK